MTKKNLLCVLSACALTFGTAVSAFAKPDFKSFPAPIGKNSFMLNAGFDLGEFYPVMIGASDSTLLGGTVSGDYALPINFALTLGLESGFLNAPVKAVIGDDPKLSTGVIPIFARVGWHPDWGVKNLDTYLLAKFGYGVGFWMGDDKNDNWTNPAGIAYGFNVGLRYFFTNSFGAFIEGGYEYYFLDYEYEDELWGVPYTVKTAAYANKFLTIGVTFKLGGAAKPDAAKEAE